MCWCWAGGLSASPWRWNWCAPSLRPATPMKPGMSGGSRKSKRLNTGSPENRKRNENERMRTQTTPLTRLPACRALVAHKNKIEGLSLRRLFDADPNRGSRLTAEAAGLFLDYSKNRISDTTLKLLLQLAKDCGLSERRKA